MVNCLPNIIFGKYTKEWKPKEMNEWLNNHYNYSRFFGPNQGYGGMNTVLLDGNLFPWVYYAEEAPFGKLTESFKPPLVGLKTQYPKTVGELQKFAGNNGAQGMWIFDVKDPALMNSYATIPEKVIYGFGKKKGGKIK